MLLSRDYVKIGQAAKILGVTQQTLRNWHTRGRLVPLRHPVNGYRMYRVADVHAILRELGSTQQALPFEEADGSLTVFPQKTEGDGLAPCHWSSQVALDPKHRPQHWGSPATTVRRDWRKYPQEAHVLDSTGQKYRRLMVDEIAILQGFAPSIVHLDGLTDRQRIAALGDAVPPPLACTIIRGIDSVHEWRHRTALEVCAGTGGLAEGAAQVGLEHLALIDRDEISGRLLRNGRPWSTDSVFTADVRDIDFGRFRGNVGLLSGGPPCQPWSRSGLGLGHEDQRDLLGEIHQIVADVQPEVFVLENVPGLACKQNEAYVRALVERLQRPALGLRYGVLAALLNAADFGVPQIRERIFFIGLRDRPASKVSACFDQIESMKTNKAPNQPGSRPRWRTIGDAIGHLNDPGGWRKWVGQ